MKLGLIFYYLGVGTFFDSLVTGTVSFFLGLVIGTFYHKTVEKEELLTRFGEDYETYKKSTPFLIAGLHRSSSFETRTQDEPS